MLYNILYYIFLLFIIILVFYIKTHRNVYIYVYISNLITYVISRYKWYNYRLLPPTTKEFVLSKCNKRQFTVDIKPSVLWSVPADIYITDYIKWLIDASRSREMRR